jgi:hypothetical protein
LSQLLRETGIRCVQHLFMLLFRWILFFRSYTW